jgi:UDP-glucose 4-epimerase
MNVIVTGGAGFIGSNLVDKLISQGHEVLVIDNFVTGSYGNLNKKGQLWRSGDDLINFFDYPAAMPSKVDVIFHLAALSRIQPSFDRPVENFTANCEGTIVALEMARKYNAKLVYAGSSTAYSDVYLNPYAFFKHTGERICELYSKVYNVPVGIARFFNVYGPRQLEEGDYATVIGIWEKQYRDKQPLTITGDGEQRRDFTHVNDIVSGLIAISEGGWHANIFNLGSGKNHSLNEVAKMFKGAEVKYIPARPGEARETLADISISKELLGWRPEYSLEQYIQCLTQ